MEKLFEPIKLGAILAPNRVLMAPLTRGRGTKDHVPTPIMSQYYAQRASAGLIITEATGISQQGLGWPYAPGIWNEAQVDAWKLVTQDVHNAGGRIILQLWHMGRIVHPSFNNGAAPVSASATTAPNQAHTYQGKQDHAQARALNIEEIPGIIEDYRRGARNAIAAGFDGVQIHAANGYLIDQFLRDGTNKRTDKYGGSIENRLRFLKEVTQAVVDEVGADRTAVRLSPNGEVQGTNDSDPIKLFTAAATLLDSFKISFLELREPDFTGTFGKADVDPIAPHIRAVFKQPLILNSDYGYEKAKKVMESGVADGIAFGRTFLANPDLPYRLQRNLALNPDSFATWFTQTAAGYTDYPFHSNNDVNSKL